MTNTCLDYCVIDCSRKLVEMVGVLTTSSSNVTYRFHFFGIRSLFVGHVTVTAPCAMIVYLESRSTT